MNETEGDSTRRQTAKRYDLARIKRFRKVNRQTPTTFSSMHAVKPNMSPSGKYLQDIRTSCLIYRCVVIALSHIVVAGAALGLGYYLGSRLSVQNASISPIPPSESNVEEPHREPEVDSEEEDEALADGDLGAVKASFLQPCKLV